MQISFLHWNIRSRCCILHAAMHPLPFQKLLCFNPLPPRSSLEMEMGVLCPRQLLGGERLDASHAFGWLRRLMGSWDPVLLATAGNGNINQILSWASLESGEGGGGGRGVCWDRAPPRGGFAMGSSVDTIHRWANKRATTTASVFSMTWWG